MTEKAPLSKNDFVKALECGLGRAFLHVKIYGDTNIEEELLHAVTHSLAYDDQAEGNRGDWMYDMIQSTSRPEFYFDKLMDGYMQDHNDRDVAQKSRILVRLAQEGNKKARDLLYSKLNQKDFEDYYALAHNLIDLDGLDGLLAYAKVWAIRGEEYEGKWYITYASRSAGESKTIRFLEDAAKSDKDIQKYIDTVKKEDGTLIYSSNEKPQPLLSIDEIVNSAEQGVGAYLASMHEFMKEASDDDVERIYGLLLEEKREAQLFFYLRLFFKRKIPYISDKIIELLDADKKHIRRSAFRVLSKVKDQRIRDVALERVNNGDFRAIDLFEENYESGDVPFLLEKIKAVADKDEVHSAGYSLLDVVKSNKLYTESDTLMWIYENTPCSQCRYNSFSLILQHNAVPEDMLNECLYDCSEDTRKVAANYLQNRG